MTTTPRKPSPNPAARLGVTIRSPPSTMPSSSVHRGVVALIAPATFDPMVCSPKPTRTYGIALASSAATSRCPHTRHPRGRRRPCHSAMGTSAANPSSIRTKTSCTGLKPRSPILIQRKPEPQSSASPAIRSTPALLGACRSAGTGDPAMPRLVPLIDLPRLMACHPRSQTA